ncbi:MAG: hypothetical protein ACRD2O_06555 [Terriglobia bacterium]
MAAIRQQGTYLSTFIAAFTAIPAGLIGLVYHRTLVGAVVTIGGILLLGYSLIGFRRIKPLELKNE